MRLHPSISRRVAGLVVVTGLTLAAVAASPPPAADDASKNDLKRFQGTWRTVSLTIDGRKIPDDEIQDRRVIIIDDRYVVVDGNKTIQRGSFRLDASKTPKQINTFPADGPNKGKVDLGIYELDGDILRLCYAPPGRTRPTEFSAEQGSGRWLTTDARVPE